MSELTNKLSNYRKVNWRDIFPAENVLRAEYDFYKSNIDISDKNGKKYIDPEYGYPEITSKINYIVLDGKWEMDSFIEDRKHKLKLVDDISGQSLEFVFSTLSDQLNFIDAMYCNKPIKQVNKGMNVESIVNGKLREKPTSWLPVITSVGLVATYFFSKRKK